MKELTFQKELILKNPINQKKKKKERKKECVICHYWYFKDIGYKFEAYIC